MNPNYTGMNYNRLRTMIQDWSPNASITNQIDDIIAMAEMRMNDDMVIKSIEKQYVGNTNGAVLFVPDDFARLQHLTILFSGQEFTVSEIAASAAESYTGTPDQPFGYTFRDQTLQLFPSPDAVYEYTLYYIPFIKTVVGGTSNWLLRTRADMYLFACLSYAAAFLKDREEQVANESKYAEILARLKSAEKARFRSIQGSSMRISRRALNQ